MAKKNIYIHDANIVFEDAKGDTYEAYTVITENGKPVSVATYQNGKPVVFDWELINKSARDRIEKELPKEDAGKRDVYAVVKHTRADFCGETNVISVASTMELAKQSFDNAVKREKAQQEKFGYSYNTVEEDDTSYTAFDEGYEATDSVTITIVTAPFIG